MHDSEAYHSHVTTLQRYIPLVYLFVRQQLFSRFR